MMHFGTLLHARSWLILVPLLANMHVLLQQSEADAPQTAHLAIIATMARQTETPRRRELISPNMLITPPLDGLLYK